LLDQELRDLLRETASGWNVSQLVVTEKRVFCRVMHKPYAGVEPTEFIDDLVTIAEKVRDRAAGF
jgi:hypothetical protein